MIENYQVGVQLAAVALYFPGLAGTDERGPVDPRPPLYGSSHYDGAGGSRQSLELLEMLPFGGKRAVREAYTHQIGSFYQFLL